MRYNSIKKEERLVKGPLRSERVTSVHDMRGNYRWPSRRRCIVVCRAGFKISQIMRDGLWRWVLRTDAVGGALGCFTESVIARIKIFAVLNLFR